MAALGQAGQLGQLFLLDHLVGNDDGLDPGLGQVLGLRQLGAGDARRPLLDLQKGDLGAFVGFIMRVETHARPLDELGHDAHVLLHHAIVQKEGGGLQLGDIHG